MRVFMDFFSPISFSIVTGKKYFIYSFSLCKYGFQVFKYTNAYIVHVFLLNSYVTSSFDPVKFSDT